MTHKNYTSEFLEIINFVVADRGYVFERQSKISDILNPDVLDPETMVGAAADALDVEFEAIDQGLISPDADTVESMMIKLASSSHP